ncbi:MAG: signal peptidase II [Tepidisphaeraceae bacterium]
MPRSPLHSLKSWLCLLLPLVLGLSLDLSTKHWAFQPYPGGLVTGSTVDDQGRFQVVSEEAHFIDGFLHFHANVNYGAVFGIGQGHRSVFVVVSVGALALLMYLFMRSGRQHLYQLLLGVLFAGVLGNLYDRMVFGYVRDMIYALPEWHIFPWIFNIADSLLCTGVGGMFVYTLFTHEENGDDALPEAVA